MEEVKDAVKKELEGPGRLLGYRAMHKKVRQEYILHVTRDAVYNIMYDLLQGLAGRTLLSCKNIANQRSTNLRSKMPLTTAFNVLDC